MDKLIIQLTVNNEEYEIAIAPDQTLQEVLRDDLNLTGTKDGCGEGACGACTVLIDGKPAYSCITLAADASGSEVMTVEGLAKGGKLHPLQKKFAEKWAFQCGFCTPGMLMTSHALLVKNPNPTEEEIRKAISGNLCRCTNYRRVIEAVTGTAEELKFFEKVAE